MDCSAVVLISVFTKKSFLVTNKIKQKKRNQNDTIFFLYLQHKTDNEYSYIYKSYYANEVNTINVSKKV